MARNGILPFLRITRIVVGHQALGNPGGTGTFSHLFRGQRPMHEIRLPFVVQVHAGFDENGSWVVRGELRYDEELSAEARELIAQEAERYLLDAMWHQAAKGRFDRGATVIRIIANLGEAGSNPDSRGPDDTGGGEMLG